MRPASAPLGPRGRDADSDRRRLPGHPVSWGRSMRVARGSASWLSSHGRGLGPRDALKKDSRGLCRGPLPENSFGSIISDLWSCTFYVVPLGDPQQLPAKTNPVLCPILLRLPLASGEELGHAQDMKPGTTEVAERYKKYVVELCRKY